MVFVVVFVASVIVALIALLMGRPDTLWAPGISLIVSAGFLISLSRQKR